MPARRGVYDSLSYYSLLRNCPACIDRSPELFADASSTMDVQRQPPTILQPLLLQPVVLTVNARTTYDSMNRVLTVQVQERFVERLANILLSSWKDIRKLL